MSDLFDACPEDAGDETKHGALANAPLADRLRPDSLNDIIGQEHLIGQGGAITRMVETGQLRSLILWGPPGVGKTTLARLVVEAIDHHGRLVFEQLSAIVSGVGDLRKIFDRAERHQQIGKSTILFVDEIHRFNRAQQDSFLGPMETGLITLIGATTQNPSFDLNPALLSRAQVFILNRLTSDNLETLLLRAEQHLQGKLPLTRDARTRLKAMADGDGRFLISMAEQIMSHVDPGATLDEEGLQTLVQTRPPIYNKVEESHYNLASALQKSIRGSDVDAALYWAARMVIAGEDPRFIFRRLIVTAAEDIGNADPAALPLAIAARDAAEFVGFPEGELPLAQLVTYLATAPKSNRSYAAWKAAKSTARKSGSLMPPPHAVNAPTQMMKQAGYGEGYIYDHDTEHGFAGLNYFPQDLPREVFYSPLKIGHEREIEKRLAWWRERRKP